MSYDLETNGFEGLVFTAGIAYLVAAQDGLGPCEEGTVCVEQWVARGRSAEPALLEALHARLLELGPDPLLSYNGASFDLPRLRARSKRHRLDLGSARQGWDFPHCDLLTCTRRLWRDRLPDCRLGTIERRLLGVKRLGDLSGFEVAERFESLSQPSSPAVEVQTALEEVIAHNAVDLCTLLLLVAHLSNELSPRQLRGGGEGPATDPWTAARAADHLERVGLDGEAIRRLEAALNDGRLDTQAQIELGLKLARLYKRGGQGSAACRILERLADLDPGEPRVCERLAMALEHRLRRPEQALAVAKRSRRPCARRVARLEVKVARASGESCAGLGA